MSIYLPEDSALPIREFSGLFKKKSESYKLFWFGSILKLAIAGQQEMTFREIIGGMVATAWYMVTEYHLNLGPSDAVEQLVTRLAEVSGLLPNAKAEKVIECLYSAEDEEINRLLYTLTLNVPYRLNAPLLHETGSVEWNNLQHMREVFRENEQTIYILDEGKGLDRKLFIRDKWFAYFRLNQVILEGWTEAEMIHYLQRRNPIVPGLSEKLSAPEDRDLVKAKKFWLAVIGEYDICNIYSPDKEDMKGQRLSIDHFIPWSYVAHDELWNLLPTTRSFNSSKSNRLPDWDSLFRDFGEVQYTAYRARWDSFTVGSFFEGNKGELINSREALNDLYDLPDLTEGDFLTRLERFIHPTWQAARDQGFQIWQRNT